MTIKKPIIHAASAMAYIVGLFLLLFFGISEPDSPDPALMPVIMLSLFVLSAAIMGYLFLGEPLMLYLDGKKKEAVRFFYQTVLSFAVFTMLAIIAQLTVFSGV